MGLRGFGSKDKFDLPKACMDDVGSNWNSQNSLHGMSCQHYRAQVWREGLAFIPSVSIRIWVPCVPTSCWAHAKGPRFWLSEPLLQHSGNRKRRLQGLIASKSTLFPRKVKLGAIYFLGGANFIVSNVSPITWNLGPKRFFFLLALVPRINDLFDLKELYGAMNLFESYHAIISTL